MCSRNRRHPLNVKTIAPTVIGLSLLLLVPAASGQTQGTRTITLDQAIQMALQHNHSLQATRTTVSQSLAQEVTANLRPNPTLFTDWEYLPLYKPEAGFLSYLHDSTEGDIGISYLFERGSKRQHRLAAAKDSTAVTRAQVTDTERGLTFQVASLFINAQLAQSMLDLAQQDLKSFQSTVDISESQFRTGGIAENDYLKIRLQLLQFQQDMEQAQLARIQALSDLRQQLGYESIPADFDVAGPFEYTPVPYTFDQLQNLALQTRPDLRAARLSVNAANSQYGLAQANSKQDVTVSTNYSHVNAISALTWSLSIPLPVFDRNQGEIARTNYAITQAREQLAAANEQVMTDVKDAWEGLQTNDRMARFYQSGYLDVSQRSRDISEYAYRRGAATLLDFLDAERSYRSTQLAWRQTISAWLLSIEQLRQAVGTRALQ
jgi:cobalt-zinc-cadmium efflux system outer membrane protein